MELKILGQLEVRIGDDSIALGGPRPRTLLAMLIVDANSAVSVDRLVDGLWGPSPPPAAVATLHGYVARLRRVLEPGRPAGRESRVVVTESGGYRLRVHPETIDVARFERLAAEGRAALHAGLASVAADALEEALALWRGPALGDLAYQEALQPHVVRLEELRRTAAEDRLEAYLACGRHREVVADAEDLLATEPLRERSRAHLMLALYRDGRQVDALRVYREFRHSLQDEVGLDPGPELQALEDAILRQDPQLEWRPQVPSSSPAGGDSIAAAPPRGFEANPPTNLPRSRSSFVGRRAELAALAGLGQPGELVTVIGPGGVGKTRLVVEAARHLRESHPDGVWLVQLGPLRNGSLVVAAVASTLGVREEPGRPLLDTLGEALAARQVLLILDNCEHLIGAVAELADELLNASASLTILATSREPLRVEGETVRRLAPLQLPAGDDLSPQDMSEIDAVRLFCERARALGPFTLTADNARSVARLTQRLDGIPLALELAASLSPTLDPAQILERLDRRFVLLAGGYRAGPTRQQTLRATVEWGHDLLSPQEQQLFRRLGVFAGSFSAEAVEHVAGRDNLITDSVASLLAALVQRCMVEPSAVDDGPRRYRLLETLQDFAVAELQSAGEEDDARGRHLRWVVELAQAFETACDRPEEQSWLDRLAAENDNLRQALEWSIRVRPREALRLAGHLGNFWARRGDLSEGRRWLSAALDVAGHAPLEAQALALRRAGVLALMQDDQLEARSLLHRAAQAYRHVGDTASLGHVLGFLGVIAYEQGDLSGARHIVEESLDILRRMGDRRGVIRCGARLGTIAAVQGEFDKAVPLLEEAVRAHADLGDRTRTAASLLNLGVARLLEGALEEARPLLEQSLVFHRQQRATLDVAQALIGLGELDLATQDWALAKGRFQKAAALGRAVNAAHIEAEAFLGLATVAVRSGDPVAAQAQLAQAWQLSRGRGLVAPSILERTAEAAVAQGEYERAAQLLGASAARRKEMGMPLPPVAVPGHEQSLRELRVRLSALALAKAWASGEAGVGNDSLMGATRPEEPSLP